MIIKIIDRQIIKNFISTVVFSLIALYVIFLVVNLIENLDDFMAAKMPKETILRYYMLYFPEIIKLLLPISVLLSSLFTIGKMSNSNEITALKSGGVSIVRILVPIMLISITISIGSVYFNGWVVPKVNKEKIEIESTYLKKNIKSNSMFNLYFRDKENNIISMQSYNSTESKGYNVSLEKFSGYTNPRLLERVEAEIVVWDTINNNWLMKSGIKREIIAKDNIIITRFDSLNIKIDLTNQQLSKLNINAKEMNFQEYKDYIETLKIGGKDIRRDLTDYYGQWAYPFASIIVVLFAVPFASVKKKGGTAVQVAAALVITFAYLIFTKVGQVVGYNSNFNPIIAGWFANIAFFVFGIIVLFRTRS